MGDRENILRKAITISNRGNRLSKEEIDEGIELMLAGDYEYTTSKTRDECAHGPRPCPWVSCKYHLYLDVSPSGGIILNFPHLKPGEMDWSCVLDETERGGMTLDLISQRLNITRERIRQIEFAALGKLRQTEDGSELLDFMQHLKTVRDFGGDEEDLP